MRCALVALTLIGGSASSWSADRKGTMDEGCCGTSFHLRVLHKGEKKGIPEKEIILYLHQGCPGHISLSYLVSARWVEVEAKLCDVGSSECEHATAAKIRLESVSHKGKHASGGYSVDFLSAGHQEGRFTVKYHHEGPIPICE